LFIVGELFSIPVANKNSGFMDIVRTLGDVNN
jgi:hypothetical protein